MVWSKAWIWMFRSRRRVLTNLLMDQPVVSSIHLETARAEIP
jgi:hypothetical protein